jgi:hypothetical protein
MTRSLYFVGGLFAMALIVFAHGIDFSPRRTPGVAAQASAAVPAADPVATAVDDLASWPVAAGR